MEDEPYPPDERPLSDAEVLQVLREVRHLISVRPVATTAARWSLVPSIIVAGVLLGLAVWSVANEDEVFAASYGGLAGVVLSISITWSLRQDRAAARWQESRKRAFDDLRLIMETRDPVEDANWFEAAELVGDLMRPDEFYYYSPRDAERGANSHKRRRK